MSFLDVNVPSRVDPSAAPEGKDTLVILVPCGHMLEDKPVRGQIGIEKANGHVEKSQDWESVVSRARRQVASKLTEKFGAELGLAPGVGFESLIDTELINTPQTWRDNLNLYKGSILGLSHNILQVLCLRPRLIHDSIKVMIVTDVSHKPMLMLSTFRNFTLSVPPLTPARVCQSWSAVQSSVCHSALRLLAFSSG